jgi:multidrug efflux pump subunit AcrA (membrane-fusion protein)
MKEKLSSIYQWFGKLSLLAKSIVIIAMIAVIWIGYKNLSTAKATEVQYQTETAKKETLVVSISASGQISAANSASVSTQTSGVVKKIFVTNGAQVKAGDAIAEVDLDLEGKQRSAQAYASYQNAKNSLDSANANYYSLQSTLYTQWKTYMDKAENSTFTNADGSPNADQRNLPGFASTQADWLAAEAKFKTQQGVIAQAQTSLSSAWASYQQSSPTIYAPIPGTITGLALQIGGVLSSQTSSTGNSTSQRIANIITEAAPQVTVQLAQIDAPKVTIGDKATILLDALPDKTFTGSIISIDTVGSVSSGVTSYPAIIKLDMASDDIFANMSATARIITETKDDVVLVPSAAVQTTNNETTVRIMKNNVVTSVPVEVGNANDTQTEIISGVSEGDVVVTGSTGGTSTTRSTTTSSPFSAFGGRGMGGGAVIRTSGR